MIAQNHFNNLQLNMLADTIQAITRENISLDNWKSVVSPAPLNIGVYTPTSPTPTPTGDGISTFQVAELTNQQKNNLDFLLDKLMLMAELLHKQLNNAKTELLLSTILDDGQKEMISGNLFEKQSA